MAKPRAVLFDIGSTLWSSPPEDPGALEYCYGCARQVLLDALGDAPPAESLIDAVEGHFAEWEEIWRQDRSIITQGPTADFVSQALQKLDLSVPPDVLAAFTDAVLDTSVYTAKVEPPEPGMKESLAALNALGLRLGCVSNAFMGANTLHRIMDERGLGEYLELTISSCEFGYRKPHPSIYEAAGKQMSLRPEEIIFVGDRMEQDVIGPARLGMRSVLSLQYRQEDSSAGEIQPDAVIHHLRELVPVAEAMLRD